MSGIDNPGSAPTVASTDENLSSPKMYDMVALGGGEVAKSIAWTLGKHGNWAVELMASVGSRRDRLSRQPSG
jgi:hypothetical protein